MSMWCFENHLLYWNRQMNELAPPRIASRVVCEMPHYFYRNLWKTSLKRRVRPYSRVRSGKPICLSFIPALAALQGKRLGFVCLLIPCISIGRWSVTGDTWSSQNYCPCLLFNEHKWSFFFFALIVHLGMSSQKTSEMKLYFRKKKGALYALASVSLY